MNVIKSNKRIEIAADNLRNLLDPILNEISLFGISHLIHMPSYLYQNW